MLATWWRADPPERSGRRHGRLQRVIERYSPIALASASVLVLTGAAEAISLVGSLSALTGSPYGRQLLFKLGAFVVLLGIGAYNWRVVRPTLGTRGASIRLARFAAVELAVAVLIIGLTASLTVLPAPGE
jgi:putative copper export protein